MTGGSPSENLNEFCLFLDRSGGALQGYNCAFSCASGVLPENVNYAVKSSFLLSFLESVPEISAKLKEPITNARKFDDIREISGTRSWAGAGVLMDFKRPSTQSRQS